MWWRLGLRLNDLVLSKATSSSCNSGSFLPCLSTTQLINKKMSKKCEFQRLPKAVVPKHYKLQLQPNLTAFTFAGQTSINIDILQPTESIILNSIDLKINAASVALNNDSTNVLATSNMTFSSEQETVELHFGSTLPIGQGVLSIDFNGELNDKMKGFYRSKYFTASGEERYCGVTQFEATDARRCFPCWDEPAIKATFDISLIVPVDRIGLSNMPIISTATNGDGLTVLTFSTTPIMSTYLVAVVVGEYDYVEGTSEDGVLVRVYTPVGKKEQGLFALDVATKVLPYYKDYFNIAYPLPKMDLIAIADFSAGAMENWGLVTYRETSLLVDPENTSLIRKQSIALTVGHEIAHQWFGNLVTMEWWTHLWLNEGYASFVEFLCVHELFPEYDIWTQFVTDMHTSALELDCLDNSHPIEVPVGHPSEIDEIFDEISYNKGACVIRMLHNYLGDEDFRKGMNIYLTRHQYKNTQTADLWTALEEASSKPVASVMSNWIKHKGFPVILVSSHQAQTKRVLKLNQKIFTADGSDSKEAHFWAIPIIISTPNSTTTTTVVLEQQELTIELQDVRESDWIKINFGTIGYYRTSYSPEMLNAFTPGIVDQSLPPLDRLGLLDDLFAMVKAGLASTDQVLRLIEAYRSETNYTVWSSITNSLVKLQILLSHTDLSDKFDAYGTKLYKPIFDKLGWNARPNENHLDTLLRSLVLNRLVSFNCPETLAESSKRFKLHVSGEVLLPADIRSACYKAVLKKCDAQTFEEMLKMYRVTDSHEEKDRISRALGSATDETILRKVIDFAISNDVRAQDSIFVIVAVAMNPRGRNMSWEFFKDNSDSLFERFHGFLLARLVKYLTENFASDERAAEVEQFFRQHTYPGTERTVSQSIEMIKLNANWLKRDLKSLTEYLEKF